MEVFYKGEDIRFTMGLFEDDSMEIPIALNGEQIDVVIYTSGDGNYIRATNDVTSSDVLILIIDENTLELTLPSYLVDTLTCGQVNMEIRLKTKGSGLSRIVKSYLFSLQDTIIKNI